MSDIYYPDPVGTVLSGQRHLVPYLRYGAGVDPLVAARPAVIVEMVIDPCPAASLSFFACGKASDVAPVVFGPQQCHIVRYPHSGLVVILHLLVEAPHLGCLSDVRVYLFSDDVSLDVHYLFQPGYVRCRSSRTHLRVISTAQSDGDDTFKIPVASDTVAPKFYQRIGVVTPAPVAEGVFISSVPLLLRPDHRFLV